jgi:hypothetical protein
LSALFVEKHEIFHLYRANFFYSIAITLTYVKDGFDIPEERPPMDLSTKAGRKERRRRDKEDARVVGFKNYVRP